MPIHQRTALYIGVIQLALGVLGFVGPLVVGSGSGALNMETGLLFGVVAVNWAHALVHLAFGVYGIAARRTAQSATTYLWAVAVALGALAVAGFLAEAGVLVRRSPDGMLLVVETAVNTAANTIHLVLAGFALGAVLVARSRTAGPRSVSA